MTIDTSGEWWKGGEPNDLRDYLAALENTYPIDEFSLALCACGSDSFLLDYDAREGMARRTCRICSAEHFICDSAEYWSEAEPQRWQCVECGGAASNVGVGFSLYEPGGDVRWLYVAARCVQCGVLGCYSDWKVAYGPSNQLLGMV